MTKVRVRIQATGPDGTIDLYFASGKGSNRNGKTYDPRVVQAGNYARYLFARGSTLGNSQSGAGVVRINNADHALDYLIDYAFDGREVEVRRDGDDRLLLLGTIGGVEFLRREIVFRIRDIQETVRNQLVVTETYAGTNSLPNGLEGVTGDWAGKNKPLALGTGLVASLPMVNTSRTIFQVSNRAVDTIVITGLDDGGSAITAGTNYSSITDMETNAPSSGQFRFFPGNANVGAYVRTGSSPVRILTTDYQEGAAVADRTVAQVMRRIVESAGFSPSIVVGDTAVDRVASWEAGYWVPPGSNATVGACLDAVAPGAHAYWIGRRDGKVEFGAFRAPSGIPVMTLDQYLILEDGTSLDRVVTDNEGLPYWRVVVGYQPVYTPMTREQLAGVALADQEYLSQPYRYTTPRQDAAIKAKHPLSRDMVAFTTLNNRTDAESLRNTMFAMYSVQRDVFRVGLTIEYSSELELNDVVRLAVPRFGLDNGKLFRVIGIEEDLARDNAVLTLWG
jgi:hypothetical protein